MNGFSYGERRCAGRAGNAETQGNSRMPSRSAQLFSLHQKDEGAVAVDAERPAALGAAYQQKQRWLASRYVADGQ
jgi:hypothetical protein